MTHPADVLPKAWIIFTIELVVKGKEGLGSKDQDVIIIDKNGINRLTILGQLKSNDYITIDQC